MTESTRVYYTHVYRLTNNLRYMKCVVCNSVNSKYDFVHYSLIFFLSNFIIWNYQTEYTFYKHILKMESNNNNKYKLIQLSEHYIEYLIPLCTIKLFHFLLYFTSNNFSYRRFPSSPCTFVQIYLHPLNATIYFTTNIFYISTLLISYALFMHFLRMHKHSLPIYYYI